MNPHPHPDPHHLTPQPLTWTDLTSRGILKESTVRLARHLGHLYQETDELVLIAAACTITALSAGSVCFDLGNPEVPHPDVGQSLPPWPPVDTWLRALRASAMVSDTTPRPGDAPGNAATSGADNLADRPLTLNGHALYLTRYWVEQDMIAQWLVTRRMGTPLSADASGKTGLSSPAELVEAAADLFFPPGADAGKRAVSLAAHTSMCVIAGGPGTGKTTMVARLLAALAQSQSPPLRVILTAPTGRAAARLDQSVAATLSDCQDLAPNPIDVRCVSGTIHRVLGIKPWGANEHDEANPLPADVVVVDEASMLSLHLMSQLLAAISDSTRLILLGDPDQLASVEAGAVLADIVDSPATVPVVRLSHTYRFFGAIADLADAIRRGSPDEALALLRLAPEAIEWIPVEGENAPPDALASLRTDLVTQAQGMIRAGRASDADSALELLDSHRLLVAHRQGPSGLARWTNIARSWIGREVPDVLSGRWYAGLPVLITRNDHLLSVFNGDCGVIVGDADLRLALPDGQGHRLIEPTMIGAWEPLYASTIHKAQGSQFHTVSLVLPSASTALLTRELFYTAVTRAVSRLRIIGSPEAIRHAISTPALRASGLSSRLACLADLAEPFGDQSMGNGR